MHGWGGQLAFAFLHPTALPAFVDLVRGLRFPSAKQWGEKRGPTLSVTLGGGMCARYQLLGSITPR